MTPVALSRFAVSLLMLAALFWAADSSLALFNHPKFPGEATLALVALTILTVLFLVAAARLYRWTRSALR